MVVVPIGFMGDFYPYDVDASTWTALSGLSFETAPTPRSHFGIANLPHRSVFSGAGAQLVKICKNASMCEYLE